jgi:hypothetical protein
MHRPPTSIRLTLTYTCTLTSLMCHSSDFLSKHVFPQINTCQIFDSYWRAVLYKKKHTACKVVGPILIWSSYKHMCFYATADKKKVRENTIKMTTNYTGYSKLSAILLLLTYTTHRLIKITKHLGQINLTNRNVKCFKSAPMNTDQQQQTSTLNATQTKTSLPTVLSCSDKPSC